MAVYVRYPCPGCSQHLSLRLEYVNRWVVCNYCKHRFSSRARIRVPEGAAAELSAVIEATNRAQGFVGESTAAGSETPPLELVVLGDPSPGGGAGNEAEESSPLALRVAQLERALARSEARFARHLEWAQANWDRERRALEHHADLWAVRYNRQLDMERVWHAQRRERIRRERDEALERVRQLELELERMRDVLDAEAETRRQAAEERQRLRLGVPYQVEAEAPGWS